MTISSPVSYFEDVFLQNEDNKPSQQRLVIEDGHVLI